MSTLPRDVGLPTPLFPGVHEVVTQTTHEDPLFICRWICLCGESGQGESTSPSSASTRALEQYSKVCIKPAQAVAAALGDFI